MNQLKKLFAVAALTACVLPVAAQYPVIPDSVKIRGEEQQKEIDRKSDEAWAASRTKDCYFSKFYAFHTQVRKKFKLKVVVAVARKVLVCIWHILKFNVPYKDFEPQKSVTKDCTQFA
jgi:hypothetical protein